jgi:hypothetical protein
MKVLVYFCLFLELRISIPWTLGLNNLLDPINLIFNPYYFWIYINSIWESCELDPMVVIVSRRACEFFCICTYGRSTNLFCAIIDGAYHFMCMINISSTSNVYMHHMFILIQNLWAFAPWIICYYVFVVLCVFCFVLIFGN